MRTVKLLGCLLLIAASGCALFRGNMHNGVYPVVLMKSYPPLYAVNPDGSCGKAVAAFSGHAGDTVYAHGVHSGGFNEVPHYLITNDTVDEYLADQDVLWIDDYTLLQCGPTVQLPRYEDQTAWGRALYYISGRPGIPLKIATDNLIQTHEVRETRDSAFVSYIVVRIPQGNMVQYQITCGNARRGFDSMHAAKLLAFYMTTGRDYARTF